MALSPLRNAVARPAPELAHSQAVALFRRICRSVPRICALYELPYTPAEVRHLVALHFKQNAGVRDPRVVQMLAAKGEMELIETENQWKQRPHLISLLQPTIMRKAAASELEPVDEDDFLERFCEGTVGSYR
mmetsp:Transcript_87465/g.243585  ORF Transcript_87465/g.243585 Transcript_87465/m.243585 type:complete len:132 (+) Transcript_87465:101-496(+)